MSDLTSWVQLEKAVQRRINTLRGTSDSDAESTFRTVPTTTSLLQDEAFPMTAIRLECIQMVDELAGYICRQEGNPYRKLYRSLVNLAAGDAAPVSMGPYGGVNFLDTSVASTDAKYRIPFDKADNPQDVLDILNYPNLFGTNKQHKYCSDGAVFYATRFPVEVECFIYTRVGTSAGVLNLMAVDALFDSLEDEAVLPNEFLSIAADGAAARLAMQASAYLDNANALMNSFIRGMSDRGFSVTPNDFAMSPKA